jgi:FlgD Ig-like domain
MKQALNIALVLLVIPVLGWANTVTYDYEPLWTTYGTGTHLPGDLAFSEDLADVYVSDFYSSGTPYFNTARIEPATAVFGNGQIINLGNIDLIIDFTADGDVTFEFLDMGGSVNLQVNGFGAVLEAADMAMLAGVVAPGVVMNVAVVPVAGGHRGTATLVGPVHELRVGGQEFWVDSMFDDNGVSSALGGCDFIVDHESLTLGKTWDGSSVSPGDWIFNENGIDVTIHELDWGTGGLGFNFCRVETPIVVDFGYNHVMNLNNVCNRYHINSLAIPVASVTFEYLDLGGTENLQVNGATLFVGNLPSFPNNVAPGVTMIVNTFPVGIGGERAVVELYGDVQDLLVGGQEFYIDDICVNKSEEPVECDRLVDHESLGLGDSWGAGSGHGPGDLAFVEDGIPVYLERFDAGSMILFNECFVQSSFSGMGDGQVMNLNNICNLYDIAAAGALVTEVTFEFLSLGGEENLQVNGAPLFIGNIELAPIAIAPGVTYSVTTYPVNGGIRGEARLVGAVNTLLLGGQEFWVDNICIKLHIGSAVDDEMPASSLVLSPNFPNPFNPRTTLNFSLERDANVKLSIHDAAGRLVKTLVSEQKSAGDHQAVWNGRDDRGYSVAAGVYLVRVATDKGEVKTQKIGLIK